ncbi:TPA: carbohydrate ABC transporter permease [Vibrio cholerae]
MDIIGSGTKDMNEKLNKSPILLFGHRIHDVILFFAVILFSFCYLLPFISMVLSSFKPTTEVISSPPSFFPSEWGLNNYIHMFNNFDFVGSLWNTLIIALGSSLLSVSIGSIAGYAVARQFSNFTKHFFVLALVARIIPPVTLAIPILEMIRSIGLIDTHFGLILVHAGINIPFVIWMTSGFFQDIPKELEDAAYVDGCNRFAIYFKVVLPVAAPGIAATSIFTLMLSWNEFLFALLLTNIEAKTAPVGISEFLNVYSSEWGAMAAAATLFTVPILILSALIQRRIVAGMAAGAVKG